MQTGIRHPKGAEIDLQPMALPHMGNQYSGAFPFGDKADEVFDSRHRVLHEVDRGRTSGTDHRTQGTTLCVEEHRVSLRGAKMSHIR